MTSPNRARVPRPQRFAALRRRMRGIAYAGRRFECPCCRGHFRTWQKVGFVPRKAGCPRCGSRERQRLLCLYLERAGVLDTPAMLRLLHVAPEPSVGRALRRHPAVRRTRFDLEHPDADVRGDIRRLPFRAEAFDVILCSHVLEHIDDDLTAMRELLRVLRPEGIAILMHPIDTNRATTLTLPEAATPEARQEAFGHWDHLRTYGRDYPDRLAAAGFAVERVSVAAELGAAAVVRYGLAAGEDVWVCRHGPV